MGKPPKSRKQAKPKTEEERKEAEARKEAEKRKFNRELNRMLMEPFL